jgi:hypothetical protein
MTMNYKVTSVYIPPGKVEEYMTIKQIIEKNGGSVSGLFFEWLSKKCYREFLPSCALDNFTPTLNADDMYKSRFLQSIKSDSELWTKMGVHLESWVQQYNRLEKEKIYAC